MNAWSHRSKRVRDTLHPDLQLVLDVALTRSRVDMTLYEGHRSKERQLALYREGKTKVKDSKHNKNPSWAVDLFAYIPGSKNLAFDPIHLAYIAGVITSVGEELYLKGKITHRIRWGGNWDKDGHIVSDQSFDDLVHFEIYKP